MKQNHCRFLFVTFLLIAAARPAGSQTLKQTDISNLIKLYKTDARGPFQAIRWFCPDGTVLPPSQRCPQPGGLQHGLIKDEVQMLADEGIYLAQILAGTPYEEFWDDRHQNSRAKQYILEKYLYYVDDGWILRKARYYRGAYQSEDEEYWGIQFFRWLLEQEAPVREHFFLIRQLSMAVPHRVQNDRLIRIRMLSKAIADSDSRFMDLRIKIHGQPEISDMKAVHAFHEQFQTSISTDTGEKLSQLEQDMEIFYQKDSIKGLGSYVQRLSENPAISGSLNRLLDPSEKSASAREKCIDLADLMWTARLQMTENNPVIEKTAMLDLSIEAEQVLFPMLRKWQPVTLRELTEKFRVLMKSAAACGFLEIWEWEQIDRLISVPVNSREINLTAFDDLTAACCRAVEWCTGMVHAEMENAMSLYDFEPLAAGFFDSCLRSSAVLYVGETASLLSDAASSFTGFHHEIMNMERTGRIRGLNPGYAVGTLSVISGNTSSVHFVPENIYVLARPPANLTPVAGILTVSEGNLVSHVQLLARNLGIPNAVLSATDLEMLMPFSGTSVFLAVSPRGRVLMKPASDMTEEERQLVTVQSRKDERVRVAIDKIHLNQTGLLPLEAVRSVDSGILCGPKAANLGQLKTLFPGHVVNGIVIPFGIFDRHLDQPIPGQSLTYRQIIQIIFREVERERKNGTSEKDIEVSVLERLSDYREWMKQMPFRMEFINELERKFVSVLGAEMGKIPVFIRSDTNVEDLKDFSGAGLNLTVFNVVDRDKILQSIREVWMSPFTDRSYRWRQKYLLNPEHVYPSILIMPSVKVDKSGVMITAGITSGTLSDITVAFNRGVAGSVEGQISEQFLLKSDQNDVLISPSREKNYTVLPQTGGVEKRWTTFDQPILSLEDRKQIREMALEIQNRMMHVSGDLFQGALDVELGFLNGRIYLFQVRPFVENKNARTSVYLKSLDPPIASAQSILWESEWHGIPEK